MSVNQTFKSTLSRTLCCVLACAASVSSAGNPLSFADEAVARGFDYDMGVNYSGWGSGILLLDLNGNGHLDIVLGGAADFHIGVFENDGLGNFTDRSLTTGMTIGGRMNGLSSADYDNDGDLDIYVNGWLAPSKLYRNNGDFTFTDVTEAAGVGLTCPMMSTSWADVDNDGYLDLYIAVRTFTNLDETENQFFYNNGDGTFTEMAQSMGISGGVTPTLVSSFFDYDRDGDSDLYIGADKGHLGDFWNILYRNDGGVFTEVTAEANAWAYVDCMSITVGDINFDGFYDLYVTSVFDGNKLLMHDGVSQYSNQTVPAGVGSYHIGWAAAWADFDNDTELDLYLCNMQGDNRLYRGSQTWPLIDEGPSAGVDESSDVFCVAVGDLDGDNDLDMVVGGTLTKAQLYINNSVDAATNNWIRFDVVGNNSNKFAIGTCIDILSAGKAQIREIRAGVNYKGQDGHTLHYGLGTASLVELVTVIFHGGEIRTLTNAPANKNWTIYPESRLGDVNDDGRIDWYEISAAIVARTPKGQTIKPGQEIFDMNGDFVIDYDDIAAMGLGLRSPSVFQR